MMDGISLVFLGMITVGALFVYSGIKGQGVQDTLRAIISGKNPNTGNQANPITGIDTGTSYNPGSGSIVATADSSNSSNQAIGKMLAAPYGWAVGDEWTALVNLWTRESGWNNYAKNPSSGAYGIPQALPESKLPYAGQEAGGSSATAQITWGLNYIKQRYGDPIAAWNHEQSAGWY